jgi:hypothetical protein
MRPAPDRGRLLGRQSARELRGRLRAKAIAGDLRGFRAWIGRPGAIWMLGRRGKQRPTLACEHGSSPIPPRWLALPLLHSKACPHAVVEPFRVEQITVSC